MRGLKAPPRRMCAPEFLTLRATVRICSGATVTDNGVGIPEKDIAHLFERFYRVEKSRTSDAGGTGLGLAIAKELVEAHGGSIAVHSEVNKGTTVQVELPFVCKLKNMEDT